jgi:hypothetical protein
MNELSKDQTTKEAEYLVKILCNVVMCHPVSDQVRFLAIASFFMKSCHVAGLTRTEIIKMVKDFCKVWNEREDEANP